MTVNANYLDKLVDDYKAKGADFEQELLVDKPVYDSYASYLKSLSSNYDGQIANKWPLRLQWANYKFTIKLKS